MSQPIRIATVVAATAAVAAGSYALYFDYQRRNNPEFRKQIRMSRILALPDERGLY
jgi:import receptor subunit TOM20